MRFLPLPASRYPLPILGCLLLALAVGLPSGSSAQQPAAQGPWKAEQSKRGDTTVVRTVSGSVWGAKVSLVEELRIGSKEGDGVDAFGAIQGLAVLPTGAVAVFDGSVPALRLFSPEGKHLRTLGRDGAGPSPNRAQSGPVTVPSQKPYFRGIESDLDGRYRMAGTKP